MDVDNLAPNASSGRVQEINTAGIFGRLFRSNRTAPISPRDLSRMENQVISERNSNQKVRAIINSMENSERNVDVNTFLKGERILWQHKDILSNKEKRLIKQENRILSGRYTVNKKEERKG